MTFGIVQNIMVVQGIVVLFAHDDRDARCVGGVDHLFTVEHDRLSRFDDQDPSLHPLHRLNGSEPHGGDVKPQILDGLAHLDHDGAFTAKPPPTNDGGVGAVDALQRQNRLVLDHEALSHVEPPHGFAHFPPESDVDIFPSIGLAAREYPFRREKRRKKNGRRFDADPLQLQFFGQSAQQEIVLLVSQPVEKLHCAPVRANPGVELRFVDGSGHGRPSNSGVVKGFDELAQLAQLEEMEFPDVPAEHRIRLSVEPHGHDIHPGLPGRMGEKQRELAAPGDEPYTIRRFFRVFCFR